MLTTGGIVTCDSVELSISVEFGLITGKSGSSPGAGRIAGGSTGGGCTGGCGGGGGG